MAQDEEDDDRRKKVIILLLVLLLLLLGFWSFSIGETTPVSVDVNGNNLDDNTPFTIDVIGENGTVVANSTVDDADDDLPLTFGLTEGENYTLGVEGDYVLENNSEFTAGDGDVTVTLVEVDDSDEGDDAGDSKLMRV